MESRRFDTLVKVFAARRPRRAALPPGRMGRAAHQHRSSARQSEGRDQSPGLYSCERRCRDLHEPEESQRQGQEAAAAQPVRIQREVPGRERLCARDLVPPPGGSPPPGCTPTCAGKGCGADDGCGGSCGCGAGLTCCAGTCVDLATDPANCGQCGRSGISGGCIHGARTCADETQCPSVCDCFKRLQGPPFACAPGLTMTTCTTDADCPLGSICTESNPGVCSMPCGG